MTFRRCRISLLLALAPLLFALPFGAQIDAPQTFLGFEPGADRTLADWEDILDYFRMLDGRSDRLTLHELGRTTLGQPFLLALISSPVNLRNLARYRNLQHQAADPRHLSEQDLLLLARESKLVVLIGFGLVASDIAGSQAALHLAHHLVSDRSAETERILEETIILLVPSLHPDALERITGWYAEYVHTPYEGSAPPFLSHPYAGDDTPGDWLLANLSETRLLRKLCFQTWFPHVVYFPTESTALPVRLATPPYQEPGDPNLLPAVLAQSNALSQDLSEALVENGVAGVATGAFRANRSRDATEAAPWRHNMVTLFTKVAGVRIATPLFFPYGSLTDPRATWLAEHPGAEIQSPWPGGWWRLHDAVTYHATTARTLLRLAAEEKTTLTYNFSKSNREAIDTGQEQPPFAYVIPAEQHDPTAAAALLNTLLRSGVRIHRAEETVPVAGRTLAKGDYVVLLAQSFRPYLRDVMEPQPRRHDSAHTDRPPAPHGSPARTLPLMLGVKPWRVDEPFEARLTPLEHLPPSEASTVHHDRPYFIPHTTDASFFLVNRLLLRRKKVYWVKEPVLVEGKTYPPGTIYIPKKEVKAVSMQALLRGLNVDVAQPDVDLRRRLAYELRPFRLGLYQPWTANPDEGWTRLLLERYGFPFKLINTKQIREKSLEGSYDVIILPDMPPSEILNGRGPESPAIYRPNPPERFRDGITDRGVQHLREFVQKGGTLIVLNRACMFALEQFGLPVENALQNLASHRFHAPGTLLRIHVLTDQPLAYGLPPQAVAFFENSPAFRPLPWPRRTEVIAHYPESDPWLSGPLHGHEHLQSRAAVLQMPMGEGRVVLIGFKAQHRVQTQGTFKFLFNAIHFSKAREVVLED